MEGIFFIGIIVIVIGFFILAFVGNVTEGYREKERHYQHLKRIEEEKKRKESMHLKAEARSDTREDARKQILLKFTRCEILLPDTSSHKQPTFTVVFPLDRIQFESENLFAATYKQVKPDEIFTYQTYWTIFEAPLNTSEHMNVSRMRGRHFSYAEAAQPLDGYSEESLFPINESDLIDNLTTLDEFYFYNMKLVYASGHGLQYLSQEEVSTGVKHAVLKQEKAYKRKLEEIKRFENLKKNSTKFDRVTIPEDVKIFVWQRDQGRCVKCHENKELEFDHIIPIAKGGGSTQRNLQLLCATCNREKSDNI